MWCRGKVQESQEEMRREKEKKVEKRKGGIYELKKSKEEGIREKRELMDKGKVQGR